MDPIETVGRLSGEISDPLDAETLEDAPALALSGGGFKAAMYHVGGLIRLNELGVLADIKRVSSVSGGSIVAGVLAIQWGRLAWPSGGRRTAPDFFEKVAAPLIRFCSEEGIDIPAGFGGVFSPFRSAAEELEEAYDERLFRGKTLQDLPDETSAPRFVFNATNLQLNSLWRFSKPYAADHRIGVIRSPNFGLAHVVAASSGFPPFFSPVILDISSQQIEPLEGADRNLPPYNSRVELGDGGIYDNVGLEAIWKRYRTLLVSNAGDPTKENPDPPDDWYHQFRRTISFIHRQAENNRIRWLMSLARNNERRVAYFALRGSPHAFVAPDFDVISLPEAEAEAARREDVRLWRLKPEALRRLVHHGYAMADASVRRWSLGSGKAMPNDPPARFPAVEV